MDPVGALIGLAAVAITLVYVPLGLAVAPGYAAIFDRRDDEAEATLGTLDVVLALRGSLASLLVLTTGLGVALMIVSSDSRDSLSGIRSLVEAAGASPLQALGTAACGLFVMALAFRSRRPYGRAGVCLGKLLSRDLRVSGGAGVLCALALFALTGSLSVALVGGALLGLPVCLFGGVIGLLWAKPWH